jgi:hypothetical protein
MSTSIEQLQAQLAALAAENAALKVKATRSTKLTCKVSEKGAVSIYGLGRFPVTLYANQMERLLGAADEIRAFCAANADKLKAKGDEPATVTAPATPSTAVVRAGSASIVRS